MQYIKTRIVLKICTIHVGIDVNSHLVDNIVLKMLMLFLLLLLLLLLLSLCVLFQILSVNIGLLVLFMIKILILFRFHGLIVITYSWWIVFFTVGKRAILQF